MDALYYQVDLLKTLNEKLTNSDRVNREFLKLSGNAYFYYHFQHDYFEAAGEWLELTGLNIRSLTDTELLIDCVESGYEQLVLDVLQADKGSMERIVREFCLKDNRTWLEGTAYVNFDVTGRPIEKFICIRDITSMKAQTDELTYMAYYDSLTGIYNRNYILKTVQDMVIEAEKNRVPVTVAMMDIDSFKKINDSIGLILGDELIQDIGQFMREFSSDKVKVGRFGADVFILAIYDPCGEETMEYFYKRLKARLKRPFVLSNKDEVNVSMSVGVAQFPQDGDNGFVLIKNAEISMFRTKEMCKGGISYCDQDILEEFMGTVSMERRLRDAIEMEAFVLYYQPQFDAATGRLRGAEALVRWVDTDGTIIPPSQFIPLAEKSGGIVAIGNMVLNEALRTVAGWQRQYHFDGVISVNLSAIQLRKENFDRNIIYLLEQYGVDPKLLELEITESVFIDDYVAVIDKLESLRQLGIRISLDDFGTGFSSLSYLKNLPIDTLKIDKSFVDSIISDESTGIITEAVVDMVRRLGLSTVAEGVENEQQYEFLRRINCDTIQGYLLGNPMPAADFEMRLFKDLKNNMNNRE